MSDKYPEIIAKSLVQAFAGKKWDEVWSLVDPRVLYNETSTNRRMRGIRNFMSILKEWEEAFPDSRITIKDAKSFGNRIVFDLQWTGTQEGPLFTTGGVIQPTGKKIDIPASIVIEIGESESGIYKFGDLEALKREAVSPKAEKITFSFDLAAMEKQIALTPGERAA